MVIISHDMDYVAENSSRVVVMAQGEILDDAVPEKVFLNADILKHAQVEPRKSCSWTFALAEREWTWPRFRWRIL